MLRQPLKIKNYKKIKDYDKLPILTRTDENVPIKDAMFLSTLSHIAVGLLFIFIPILLLFLGVNLVLFQKPEHKTRDIEFVLVNQPEKEPINKKTPLRADRNTQAGGIHDPNKKIAPPQPALPKSAPSQAANEKPQKVINKIFEHAKPQPQPQTNKQKVVTQQQEAPKTVKKEVAKTPLPPKPSAKPMIPPTKQLSTMRMPIPPTKNPPKLSASSGASGPVSSKPTYSGSNYGKAGGQPKPVIASGGYGTGSSSRPAASSGAGRGSAYSPGGGNVGNPGPGNPKGAPGVDAIREPNFGPYMAELQRRIKSNWDPPRGDESKRVVLLFKIAKDGRLLNVKVVKSSGVPGADKAAIAAVQLTAPFRPLPSDFKGASVDIQFTFDYNVFGVGSTRY